jgi:hypothetical protein
MIIKLNSTEVGMILRCLADYVGDDFYKISFPTIKTKESISQAKRLFIKIKDQGKKELSD